MDRCFPQLLYRRERRHPMRVLTLLLVAAMAQTLFVFRPVAPPAPTAPPPGYTKAKADAVFNSSFKRFTSTPQALAVYRLSLIHI